MIKHVVAFRFRSEVDAEARERLLGLLAGLPAHFAAMQRFALGENRSNRDDRFSHGFTVEFEDWSALEAYLSSDRHERFVVDEFRPVVAERAIISFEAP